MQTTCLNTNKSNKNNEAYFYIHAWKSYSTKQSFNINETPLSTSANKTANMHKKQLPKTFLFLSFSNLKYSALLKKTSSKHGGCWKSQKKILTDFYKRLLFKLEQFLNKCVTVKDNDYLNIFESLKCFNKKIPYI